MTEKRADEDELVNDFLGSAQIFANAVSQVIERKLWREASGSQFNVSHLKVLKLAGRPGPHTVGDVAAFLGVSNAAASKAVDKLVVRRLLERAAGEEDRRTMYLAVTEFGRRLLAAYDSAARRKLSEVFRFFAPEELRRTMDLLDRLSVHIVHHAMHEEFCVQCGIYTRDECLFRKRLHRQCSYLRKKERTR